MECKSCEVNTDLILSDDCMDCFLDKRFNKTNHSSEAKECIIKHYHMYCSKRLSIYLGGNFCAIEIDMYTKKTTRTLQLFTNKGFVNYFSYTKA